MNRQTQTHQTHQTRQSVSENHEGSRGKLINSKYDRDTDNYDMEKITRATLASILVLSQDNPNMRED